MTNIKSQTGLVHMASRGGHREDYQRVLCSTLNFKPSTGKVGAGNLYKLLSAKALFFGSLDDDVPGFLLIAIMRMLVGKKTAGLFLRPQSCFLRTTAGLRFKYLIFRALSNFRAVSVFTIVPFEVEPKYRQVAKYGLADPQLWDRSILPFQPSSDFAKHLRAIAAERRILAFIGTASPFKGVAELRNMMMHPEWDASVCVICAGQVPESTSEVLEELQARGALVIPRFISNEELDALYEEAHFIWAGYLPGYDQASGNFGRALQAGRVPIVREGTLIERLAQLIGYPVLAVDFEDLQTSIARLQGPPLKVGGPPYEAMVQWRDEFIQHMKNAL